MMKVWPIHVLQEGFWKHGELNRRHSSSNGVIGWDELLNV